MGIFRTDDPIADFNRYDAEQQRRLKKRPKCRRCNEHIQDDEAYYIEGDWICENCIGKYLKIIDEE